MVLSLSKENPLVQAADHKIQTTGRTGLWSYISGSTRIAKPIINCVVVLHEVNIMNKTFIYSHISKVTHRHCNVNISAHAMSRYVHIMYTVLLVDVACSDCGR